MIDLHDLKSFGYHQLRTAREQGASTAVPLMFVGAASMMLGAVMLNKGLNQWSISR